MTNLNQPNVFSAFDGISCGQLALTKAGVEYDNYFASELPFIETPSGKLKPNPVIDIVKYHFPNTKFVGDITKVDGNEFRRMINILLGGSPCQSFSVAGNRDGFDGKSKLFYEYVRLKEQMNPEFFLLENVVMRDKWIHVISDILGVDPIFINSSIISAQNRPRLYWTNIPYTPIEDHGILLGDIIHGAITGASKHGEDNPLYGLPGEPRWKAKDWKFNPDNKSRCLVRSRGNYLNIQGQVVKLTPENCELLQTVPVGYTGVTGLCDSSRIEALGNAWTVDVLVEAFFKNLPWATELKDDPKYNFSRV